ncbi:hypothetical protein [Vreelandella sp. TE19]
MNCSLPCVPKRYRGVWQRTLYGEPATSPYRQTDTETQVFWLQGERWHADLRLPKHTPDFTGIERLEQCHRTQLTWLAGLTAFAGITQVEQRLCTWHRFQDLCPGLEQDVGLLMVLDDVHMEEHAVDDRYVEHWRHIADPSVKETVRTDTSGRLRWLELGDHAIEITPRSEAPHASALFEPLAAATHDTLRWRASLRFDYLQRSQQGWHITLSTHPWRTGGIIRPRGSNPSEQTTN